MAHQSFPGQALPAGSDGNGDLYPAAHDELRDLRRRIEGLEARGAEDSAAFAAALQDLKVAIPGIIAETVAGRLLEIEEAFHRNVKEIHSRSVDSFTQSVQAKVGQRIAALESNLSLRTEAMGQLREQYLKTDRNVQRLMSGLDRLTAELMRVSPNSSSNPPRTANPAAAPATRPYRETETENSAGLRDDPVRRARQRSSRRSSAFRFPIIFLIVAAPVALFFWFTRSGPESVSANREPAAVSVNAKVPAGSQPPSAADSSSRKDYANAERFYRAVLKTDPKNRVAIKELANILSLQQRFVEASAVLASLPPE